MKRGNFDEQAERVRGLPLCCGVSLLLFLPITVRSLFLSLLFSKSPKKNKTYGDLINLLRSFPLPPILVFAFIQLE